MILTDKKIAKAIKECAPTKIAVAFIGRDWRKYISNPKQIENIIISPRLGSNPIAIHELAKKIGWNKVSFLDELHAKVYLGSKFAVLGSANLTNNGLSDDGLTELCTKIKYKKQIKELHAFFDQALEQAQERYPTTEAKKQRLETSYHEWNKAVSNDVVRNKKTSVTNFLDFELLSKEHFYISWFNEGDMEYSEEYLKEDRIVDEIHFLPTDKVSTNKWVLLWRRTNEEEPDKRRKPYWLYIHDIFHNAVIEKDYSYTTVAVQQDNKKVPTPPFAITNEVAEALKASVANKSLAKYFAQPDELYDLNQSKKGLSLLIEAMKTYIKKHY